MSFTKADLVISDISPWDDLLLFEVQLRGEDTGEEWRLLCLDARTHVFGADKLSSMVFYWNPGEHTIIIGEVGEERFTFLEVSEDHVYDANFKSKIVEVLFPK